MRLRSGVAVDLGTVNSLVHVRGRGVVLDEPSTIALYRHTDQPPLVGERAEELMRKEPVDIDVLHPLREGVITELDAAATMLQTFLRRARFRTSVLGPRAVICVPSGASFIERRALVAAASFHRPRLAVRLLDEPVAAAIGAGAEPQGTDGVLIVDVGGGTTEAAIVLGAHMVRVHSLRVGGNAMDEAIVQAVKAELGLHIGLRAAEHLKKSLGLTGGASGSAQVAGIDLARGTVREEQVRGPLVASALEHVVAPIIESVQELLWEMPPDLADGVIRRKVQLAGGGALLPGLASRLRDSTGVTTVVVEKPLRAVVRGAATMLEHHYELLPPM
ncbi:MAG: rod shape-determining protein [Actinomycetota bacterium]|jgi:rod shape-determining protein MreB|nr:rod shape-determining protein [Actinomycetota bacterium]